MMTKDRFADAAPTRSTPSVLVCNLTAGDLSDVVDLPIWAKAFEIQNNTAAAVRVRFTPVGIVGEADPGTVSISVPAGALRIVVAGARRIWSTGSTGLAAGLAADTIDVLLHQV